MNVEIKQGAKFETITPGELKSHLASWMTETVKGVRPVRFNAYATVAGNALSIGGNDASVNSGRLGPEPGFMWALRRIAVSGLTNASDPTSLYLGINDPIHLVYPNLTGIAGATGYKAFNSGEVLMDGGDKLLLASTGAIAATGQIHLVGSAIEFPVGLLWKTI